MLNKLWGYIAAAGALVAAIFIAYFKGSQAKANEIKAETEEAAREYQNAGSEALIGGLEDEQKVKNEKVDTDKRDHFSR